jgi:hypothetical protein
MVRMAHLCPAEPVRFFWHAHLLITPAIDHQQIDVMVAFLLTHQTGLLSVGFVTFFV